MKVEEFKNTLDQFKTSDIDPIILSQLYKITDNALTKGSFSVDELSEIKRLLSLEIESNNTESQDIDNLIGIIDDNLN